MRKRSSYKPRPVLRNPIQFVVDNVTPVTDYDTYLVDLKLTNHSAMEVLLKGEATKVHIDVLIACHNIIEAFWQMLQKKIITDLPIELDSSTIIRAKAALLDLSGRGIKLGRFVCKAPEIQAMNDLMQLHDELMGLITVGHMDKAIAYAKNEIKCKRATSIGGVMTKNSVQ